MSERAEPGEAHEPKDVVRRLRRAGRERGIFSSHPHASGGPPCIVVPAPNGTGVHHARHRASFGA